MKSTSPFKLIVSGFLVTAALQLAMPISCKKQLDPVTPIDDTGQTDTQALQQATKAAEAIFLKEDVPGVVAMLTPDAKEQLKDVVPLLKPYLKNYGEAFKTRKLEFATPLYAEYSFTFEGKSVSVAFSHTDDNQWKLMRI